MVSLDCNMMAAVSSASSSHITIRGTNTVKCNSNTTTRSQNIFAPRSDFEMLLTNGL